MCGLRRWGSKGREVSVTKGLTVRVYYPWYTETEMMFIGLFSYKWIDSGAAILWTTRMDLSSLTRCSQVLLLAEGY